MTRHAHDTFETVADDNFDEGRYLAANPDLRIAKRDQPTFDLYAHFKTHGKAEGRKQLSYSSFRRPKQKYNRFASILRPEGYHFPTAGHFPMISDGAYFDIADYEGESANRASENWISELSNNPKGAYVDLGCGLRDIVFDNCLYIEVYPSLSADIVITPNNSLPIKDNSLDGLYCAAVLEHVENPFFVAGEIKRVVKGGGYLFIDWPFLQPVTDIRPIFITLQEWDYESFSRIHFRLRGLSRSSLKVPPTPSIGFTVVY